VFLAFGKLWMRQRLKTTRQIGVPSSRMRMDRPRFLRRRFDCAFGPPKGHEDGRSLAGRA
jgi:hypothetical protein